jgi:WD40 repeat protein/S1-C subfamily serine protease
MSFDRNRKRPDPRGGSDARATGLRAVLAIITIAGLLVAPGRRGFAQEGKAEKAQEAKLGLGDLIKQANQGVVLITVENNSGQKIGFGSGFLIDDKGLVATNLHVIARAAKARVAFEFKDGNAAFVKCLRALDKKSDLAILELEKTPPAARPLGLGARALPAAGDTVTAIGHPQGLNFTATNGIVGGIRRNSDRAQVKPEDDRVWIQSTAFIGGGSSGGPLLSDTGRVIGINTSVLTGQGIAFAIHIGHLVDLLAKAKGAAPQPLPGHEGSDLYNPLADLEPRVKGMYEEYTSAVNEFNKQIQGATNQFQLAIIQKTQNPGPKYAQRFFQIAERDRKSTAAFQALYLACVADDSAAQGSVFKTALDRILEDHATKRWVHHAFQGLYSEDHPAVAGFFRETLKRNPHRTVQAAACYYLANWLKDKPKYDEAEVLTLLKRCADEFKDVQLEYEADDRQVEYSVAALAKPALFALEHLSEGKKAAEIAGKDVDGKPFRLSEYAGKVVVLDFFVDWCPYCVNMYPEERQLAGKLAGKPFAILGVNCDSQDTLRQILADKKVTWRCWSDGKEGPIADEWQVDSFPRMFVLDHQGVIRHKFVGQSKPGQLQQAVNELLKAVPGYRPAVIEVASFSGHSTGETVEFAAISPDGGRILSGGADRMVILWDRKTGREIRRFGPAGGRVLSALFSPDGRRAFTAGEDKLIRIWDLETGKLLRELKGHDEWVFSLAVSPDGRFVYSTSGGPDIWRDGKDSAIRIWETETGREVRKLEGHKGRVLSVAVSPDGRQVLTGGDTTVILWDATSGKIIRRFSGHTSLLSRVSFLPDGKGAVSSSFDKTIRLWDLETGKEVYRLAGHPNEVTWFAVSPDGRRLLSSDYNAHELRLWDLNTHEQIDHIDLGRISPTRGSFAPDGRLAIWPGTGGFLRLYEFPTPEPATPLARATQSGDSKAPGAKPAGTSK